MRKLVRENHERVTFLTRAHTANLAHIGKKLSEKFGEEWFCRE